MSNCIYEKTYNAAKKSKKAAEDEITRCNDALDYFKDWKQKIRETIDCIDAMHERNTLIASLCDEIILNGKPIDEGENHYPNGSADIFSIKLDKINKVLKSLIDEINDEMDQLNESLRKAKKTKNEAANTLKNTPKPPCGKCSGCLGTGSTAAGYY